MALFLSEYYLIKEKPRLFKPKKNVFSQINQLVNSSTNNLSTKIRIFAAANEKT